MTMILLLAIMSPSVLVPMSILVPNMAVVGMLLGVVPSLLVGQELCDSHAPPKGLLLQLGSLL